MEMSLTQLRGDYSPMEQVIFEVLRREAATSSDLVRKVYPRKGAEPFNAQIVVNKAVITLARKLTHYREPFRLERKRLPKRRLIENRLVRNKSKLIK